MAPAKVLTITKGGDGGFTTNVYAGKVYDIHSPYATTGMPLAYTLNRSAQTLSISPGKTHSRNHAGMIATITGFMDATAKISGDGLTYSATRRISSHAWKFTDDRQQKFKWHVDSQGRHWDLRTKGGSTIATFTNNGPFESTLGVLEFPQRVGESFTQLALLTWTLTRKSLDDQRRTKGANHSPFTTNAWFIDGFYGSDGSGNGHHGWYSTGDSNHHHGGGHHHGDHGGGHHHGDHGGWGGDSGGGDCGGGGGGGGGDGGGGGGGGS